MSDGLAFKISSTREILGKQDRLQLSNLVPNGHRPNDLMVTFPTYQVATLLFQSYESNVDHLCHILHKPTVRSVMNTCYLRIDQKEPVSIGQAALLLSIFAIAAYFYRTFDKSEVATTQWDALNLSKILSRNALDVLDYSRRNTSGTLEDVQASILMSFVTYHLDGFSARGRLLSTAAISIAREIRLHRLDADLESSADKADTSLRSLIDREVKRRVFWQMASTDWCAVVLF